MSYADLPQEIIRHILSYSDSVKWRNGKYMDQIPHSDRRYTILLKIPRQIITGIVNHCYYIKVKKRKLQYIHIDYGYQYLKYTYIFDQGTRLNSYYPLDNSYGRH